MNITLSRIKRGLPSPMERPLNARIPPTVTYRSPSSAASSSRKANLIGRPGSFRPALEQRAARLPRARYNLFAVSAPAVKCTKHLLIRWVISSGWPRSQADATTEGRRGLACGLPDPVVAASNGSGLSPPPPFRGCAAALAKTRHLAQPFRIRARMTSQCVTRVVVEGSSVFSPGRTLHGCSRRGERLR